MAEVARKEISEELGLDRTAIVADLKNYKDSNGLTWEQLSAELRRSGFNYSRATVRCFFDSGYDGDRKLALAVRRFLKMKMSRRPEFKTRKHYETAVSAIINGAMEIAAEGKIVVLSGISGNGKSHCSLNLLDKRENAVYVRCYQSDGVKGLVKRIALALGLKDGPGTGTMWMTKVIERVTAEPVVLILDEANYLGMDRLNALRDLWDESDRMAPGSLGLFLIGSENIVHNFSHFSTSKRRIEAEQFMRRVAFSKALPGFDQDKVGDKVRELFPEIPDEILTEICKWIGPAGLYSAGRLDLMLGHLSRFSKNGKREVTAEMVTESAKLMMV